MSKSFIPFPKELPSIESCWYTPDWPVGRSKSLLASAKKSPRGGCVGSPAEMSKWFVPFVNDASPRGGGCGTVGGSAKMSKSFIKDASTRGGGCGTETGPAEMSKSFIKDTSTRGGEYSATLVS